MKEWYTTKNTKTSRLWSISITQLSKVSAVWGIGTEVKLGSVVSKGYLEIARFPQIQNSASQTIDPWTRGGDGHQPHPPVENLCVRTQQCNY